MLDYLEKRRSYRNDYSSSRSGMRGGLRGSFSMRPMNFSQYDSNYDMDYARGRRMRDYNYDDSDYDYRSMRRDYGYDMGYDYGNEDMKEYMEDVKMITQRLKSKDRFSMPKEEVIKKAREMNVQFKEYTEDEFYLVYLMQVSDYPQMFNDPHSYIAMAKAWLEDSDVKRKNSDKLCAYLYSIILGE